MRDIAIHPREHDLILATHGRGILIVDDITPLRQLTPETIASSAVILNARPSVLQLGGGFQGWSGDDEFVGRNPSNAATITYYLKERHIFGDMKLEIYDAQNKLLSTLPGGKRKGVNRVDWAMQLKPPKVAVTPGTEGRIVTGPTVSEGTYGVKLIKGKDTITGSFRIVGDPNSPHTAEDRALRQQIVMKLYDMQADMAYVAVSVSKARNQASERASKLDSNDALARELRRFAGRLDSLYHTLVATSEGRLAREEQLREKVIDLYASVSGYDGRPTGSQLERLEVLRRRIADADAAFKAIANDELPKMNASLESRSQQGITLLSREEFDKE